MRLLALSLKDRGDGLELSVTYSYQGKLPDKKRRRAFAREALAAATKALDEGREVDAGFAEDGQRRLRRDQWIVDKGTP